MQSRFTYRLFCCAEREKKEARGVFYIPVCLLPSPEAVTHARCHYTPHFYFRWSVFFRRTGRRAPSSPSHLCSSRFLRYVLQRVLREKRKDDEKSSVPTSLNLEWHPIVSSASGQTSEVFSTSEKILKNRVMRALLLSLTFLDLLCVFSSYLFSFFSYMRMTVLDRELAILIVHV